MPYLVRPANSNHPVTAHPSAGRASPQGFKRTVLACAIGYACATGLAAVTFPGSALAADAPAAQTQRKAYAIPAGPLEAALNRFGREAGVLLSFPTETTAGRQSPGLRGNYGVQEGLSRLLQGTGLAAVAQANGSYALVAAPVDKGQALTTLPEVKVTAAQEGAFGPDQGYVAGKSATATKTDTPLIETPQSISVITKDQLDTQEADTIGEALRYSAGIKGETFGLEDRGFGGFTDIRGFSSPSFRDGLQLNTPGFAGFNNEIYLSERVEILRGPASVLYGQGSPGGIINHVTKRPLDKPFREFILEAGSFDRLETKFDVSDLINEDGSLSYRLTGLASDGEAQVDFIERERVLIAPALTWKPSSDTTLTFLSLYNRDNQGGASNSFLPSVGTVFSNPNGRIRPSRFTGEESFDSIDREQFSLGYLLEHRFNERWSFRQNLRYDASELDFRALFGGGLDPSDLTQRTLTRFSFSALADTDVFSVDNQLQAKFETGSVVHTVLFGLDHQSLNFDQAQGFDVAPSLDLFDPVYGAIITPPALFSDALLKQRQTGLYIQDQIKFSDKYVLQLGGRYDWASSDRRERLFGGSREDKDDSAFTGRLGFVYLADNGLAPYASYAESFQPVAGAGIDGAFKPETGQQYEVGIKYEPPGANAFVTLAAFDLTRQNVVSGPFGMQSQSGEEQSRGIELEGVASLDSGLDLKAAYTYLDLEITENEGVNEGNTPDGRARHRASLLADYTIKQGELAGLGFSAGVRYTGESFGDSANTFEVDSFTLVDASIHYDWQRLRLGLSVQNLFDKEYVERCFDETGCFYGATREITASLRYRFD